MIITNVFEKKYENIVKCCWKRVFDVFTYRISGVLLRRRYLYFGCTGVGEWIVLVAVW